MDRVVVLLDSKRLEQRRSDILTEMGLSMVWQT